MSRQWKRAHYLTIFQWIELCHPNLMLLDVPVAVKLIKRLDGDKKLPNEKNILEIYHENIIHVIKVGSLS